MEAGRSRPRFFQSGRAWRLAGALSLSGAAALVMLPEVADGLIPFDVPAAVWTSLGWWRPAAELRGSRPEPVLRPPLTRSACPCRPPDEEPHWSRLVDFIHSYPVAETAVLAANGGALDAGSFQRLDYGLPRRHLYGIRWDPTADLGYRFLTRGPHGEAVPADRKSDGAALALPPGVRTLIIPDPSLAGLLDPSLFVGERRYLGGGIAVTVARVQEGSVLELREHGDHVHIGLRRLEGVNPADPASVAVLGATRVSQITGPTPPNRTAGRWNVWGTDLGSVFWYRDRLYMAFGDTFGKGSRKGGRHWRSNVLARLVTPGPSPDALRIESMIPGPRGMAREILRSTKVDGQERTVLPTSGISIGDRMFLHYMSVQKWFASGHWRVGHSGIAYSDDEGSTWIRPRSAVWPGGLGFEQAALVRHEGMIYSFGIPGGRYGPARLRRVPEARILDASAYEYWDGSDWSANPEDAVPLIPAPVGQLSVAWNPRYRLWMMMYLQPSVDAVVLRLAPKLIGPWSERRFVVRGKGQHPGLYAPYIVPLPETGEHVWFAMSEWWEYNVYLMRMTLGPAPLVTR